MGVNVVGLTGLKGSGKDTAARVLESAGFVHLKFAGPLKAMLGAFMTWQGASSLIVERSLDGDLKEVPSPYLGDRSPRHAMQTLGTEWGRQMIAASLWTDALIAAARRCDKVVVSDVRFPNEAAVIEGLGGRVYRVERGLPPDDPHPSERLVIDLPVVDVLRNSAGSAAAFAAEARRFFTLKGHMPCRW